jgi:hypothetical protein
MTHACQERDKRVEDSFHDIKQYVPQSLCSFIIFHLHCTFPRAVLSRAVLFFYRVRPLGLQMRPCTPPVCKKGNTTPQAKIAMQKRKRNKCYVPKMLHAFISERPKPDMQERKETKGKGIKRRYEDAPSTLEGEDDVLAAKLGNCYLSVSWPFLYFFLLRILTLKQTIHPLRTPRRRIKVNSHKPRTQYIRKMMQHIRIRDTVNRSVCSDGEEQNVREERDAVLYPWDHAAGTKRLDEQDERHDGEDVVVGGKGCEPMDG